MQENPVFSWVPAFAGMTPPAAIYAEVYLSGFVRLDQSLFSKTVEIRFADDDVVNHFDP
jgi:hypothetical protein